jgi:hypothetical protein
VPAGLGPLNVEPDRSCFTFWMPRYKEYFRRVHAWPAQSGVVSLVGSLSSVTPVQHSDVQEGLYSRTLVSVGEYSTMT